MNKILPFANGLFFLGMVFINYLSNTGAFNGETMGSISAQYQNLFTPAGYAFSIWGLIYLLLAWFVIYFGPFRPNQHKAQTIADISGWFILSCVVNSLWVVCWLYEATLLSVLLMIALLCILWKIVSKTKNIPSTAPRAWFVSLQLPFQLYTSWITVALMANMAAYLTKIGWDGLGLSEPIWAIVLLCLAGALHMWLLWKERMPAMTTVAIWAVVAIAIPHQGAHPVLFWLGLAWAIALGVQLLLYLATSFNAQKSIRRPLA